MTMSAALLGLGVVLAVVLLPPGAGLPNSGMPRRPPLATVKGLITQLLAAPAPRKGITVAIPAGHVAMASHIYRCT
jgi:hypothetical protein